MGDTEGGRGRGARVWGAYLWGRSPALFAGVLWQRLREPPHQLTAAALNPDLFAACPASRPPTLPLPPQQSKQFKEFCARNREWLQPYAVFCFLRDLFGTAEHWKWGAFSTPTPEVLLLGWGAGA